MTSLSRIAIAFALVLPWVALAETPLVIYDERVAQYRAAAVAAKKSLPDAQERNPSAPDLAIAAQDASVIVAIGQQALSAAQKAAPSKPIVYCLVLGMSLNSTATVTGVPMEADPAVVFGHVRALSPGVKRVGFLHNPATSEALLRRAKDAAAQAGMTLVPVPVGSADQVKSTLTARAAGMDAVWLPPDPKIFTREVFAWMLSFTSERKLPLYGFLDSYTEAGALASLSPDYDDIGQRAGRLAQEIASRPASQRIPVPPPAYSPGKLTVNLQTARALGIDMSPRAIAEARQVYR